MPCERADFRKFLLGFSRRAFIVGGSRERSWHVDELNFSGWQAPKSVEVVEADGTTRVLVKGQLYMSWPSGDEGCLRLAMVQLSQCGLGKQEDLAAAFGRHITSLQRYVADFADQGMPGLVPERRVPRGAWKLTSELRGKIL